MRSTRRPAAPPPTSPSRVPTDEDLTLSQLRGRTVLVNLWATWCLPCREEMPALDKLQADLGAPDFEVVAINVDTRNPDKPKAWLKETGVTQPRLLRRPGGKVLQVLQQFRARRRAADDPPDRPERLRDRRSSSGPAAWASAGRDDTGSAALTALTIALRRGSAP